MESRAKLLGHPVHPMLIVLPLGLFIAAVVFDGVYLWRGSPAFATVAYWNIAAVWWMRADTPELTPTTNLFLLEIVALVLGSVAGWLGGELVDRLAVGVDDGAHLDAPSSLSGRPARQR